MMLRAIREEKAKRAHEAERLRIAQDAERIRAKCQTLKGFITEAWHILEPAKPMVTGWALDAVCEHFEAITTGDINRLLVNVPPGFMKSLVANVFWPAWEWQQMPHLRHISFSYASILTHRDNGRFRDLLMSPWYQGIFGDRFTLRKVGEERVTNNHMGWKFASSVGGVGTGERGDRVCFPADEVVWTENGPAAIGDVVRQKRNVRVWSTNIETGETRLRIITAWHRNPASEIVRVNIASGGSVRCTPDHKFWTQRGWVEASSLRPGDMLPDLPIADAQDEALVDAVDVRHIAARSLRTENLDHVSFRKLSMGAFFAALDIGRIFGGRVIETATDIARFCGQIQVRPNVTTSYAGDSLVRDAIFSSNLLSGFGMLLGNGTDFVLGQFRRAVAKRAMFLAVGNVLSPRAVFDVIKARVRAVAVPMSDFLSSWARANEGRCHELVDEDIFGRSILPHRDARIAFVEDRVQHSTWDRQRLSLSHDGARNALDAAMGGDEVIGETVRLSPRFHVVTSVENAGHADETFCLTVDEFHTMYCGVVPTLVSNCLDDPHNVKEAESDTVRKETVRWVREGMSNRLNDMDESAIAVIMQRVHEDDVSGALIELGGYDHLMIPMEWDGRRYSTSIGWTDPRDSDGELAWPQRFSKRVVEDFKTTLGPYGFAGQYQQAPTPRGGGIFKRDWWQLWGNPDDPDDPQFKKFPACEYIIGSLDTAYTQKTENDFSAMTVWGIYYDRYDMPKAILMNAWRARLALHDLVERTALTCRRFKIDRLLVESKAAGISVAQELQRLHAAEGYGVQLVDPKGGDKTARAYAIQHLFADEMIYAPDRDWADMVITEMASFPRAPHDDLVDSATMALKHLRDIGLLIHGSEMAAELADELTTTPNNKPLYPV